MDTMMAAASELTVEEVLDAFAEARHKLPREALQWALDHWESAGPRFVALLEACANGEDRSERTYEILFFAMHLLAEKRDTRAFPALCRLLLDAECAEAVLS